MPLNTYLVLDDGCAPACHLPPPGVHSSGQDVERQRSDQQQQSGSYLARMCVQGVLYRHLISACAATPGVMTACCPWFQFPWPLPFRPTDVLFLCCVPL